MSLHKNLEARTNGLGEDNTYDFVIVSHRLPVERARTHTSSASWQPSPGGLATALRPVMSSRNGVWIGWAGDTNDPPSTIVIDGMELYSVPLSREEITHYYEGQSNTTIWPLYHDCVQTPEFRRTWRESYRHVNEKFARATARLASPGAVVWIHDYQLQLVPGILRKLRPDLRIGFFLHIPFPPTELFLQMPLRTEIIEGLLGADLIGFQHPGGARNFLHLTQRLLGLQPAADHVHVEGRQVTVAAFPISIDTAEIEGLAADPAVQATSRKLRENLGNPDTVLLGVDRLDYTKGIEHRLTAFEELLRDGKLSAASTILVQVAVPTRERVDHYQRLRGRVNRMVGRINGDFGAVGQPAVHYLNRSLSRRDLVALYLAADVMLVTPLRDGMNLVAKEYVIAHRNGTGSLVLSEFAGAAAELSYAHLVNPHDIDALKNVLMSAIHAGPQSTSLRMRLMRDYIRRHDVHAWARDFLNRLYGPATDPRPQCIDTIAG